MYHDAYAGIAVVCMSGIIVIQSGCQGKRHTHIVISFVHQPFKGYRERYRVAFARLKRQGNGIDQHCQAWDATTATDVCEEVHRTGRLMVAGMCRHLHQHLIRAGFGIGMHPTKRHSSQRTGSVAKLAQYRFRRILVYVGGTLPVVVSNRNGCGMRRQRYGKAARQTGTVNQHISHGLRTILASISDPNRHGGLTYYMSQHMRPAAHHHRNNRSGGQCHDFVQHFILVPRQTDVGQIHAFTAGGTVFGYGLCRTIVVEFTVIAAFAGAAAYEYHGCRTRPPIGRHIARLGRQANPVFPKACHQLPVDA